MCESDVGWVTCGGVSNEVIYVWALRVDAQQNGLWAATLTDYGPVCKGEGTESDLCSARCLRGSNVRCMLWWKWVNVFLYHIKSLVTVCAGYCLWIIDYLDGVKRILMHVIPILIFFLSRFAHGVLVCFHVLMCVAICVVVHNTMLSRVIQQDLPHLENSDSHHCNRLWQRSSSQPWLAFRTVVWSTDSALKPA